MGFPLFEINDLVVFLDHDAKTFTNEIYEISGVLEMEPNEFFYVIKGVPETIFPEYSMRLYDPTNSTYDEYFTQYPDFDGDDDWDDDDWDIDDEVYEGIIRVIESEKQKELPEPVPFNADLYLDAYNFLTKLYEITKDEDYKKSASDVFVRLKNKEPLNMKVYMKYLNEE